MRATGIRSLLAALLAGLVAACAPSGPPGGATLTQEFWPTETLSGEAGDAKKVLLGSIEAGAVDADEALAWLTPDFRGEDFAARPRQAARVGSGIRLAEWAEVAPALDGRAFLDRWNEYLAEFEQVLTVEVHTWEVQLRDAPAEVPAIETREAVWILGRLPDGRLREDRLYLVLDLRRPAGADGWRLAGVRSAEGRTTVAPGPFFRDVTGQVLPPGFDQSGAQIYTDGGPVLADFDRDGDIDLFLPRLHAAARLYENDGAGYFDDVTAERGLELNALRQGSNSGLFLDFDGDGAIDLVIGLKNQGLRLLRNEGSFFRDVTGGAVLAGPGEWESLAAADYDGDGLVDVYLTNYNLIDADHQPESYVDARDGRPNALLRNLGEGRFEEVTDRVGMGRDRERWSYAAAWADYDRDGDLDLYVANDYGPNNLYRNDGEGRFEDAAIELAATDSGNGMGVSWADYDGDGWLDLYISNMQSFAGNRITRLENFPGTPEQRRLYRRFSKGNTLLRNLGGEGFTDVTDASGAKPAFWAWGNVPLDYDSDGDLDYFVCGGFYTGLSAKDT